MGHKKKSDSMKVVGQKFLQTAMVDLVGVKLHLTLTHYPLLFLNICLGLKVVTAAQLALSDWAWAINKLERLLQENRGVRHVF